MGLFGVRKAATDRPRTLVGRLLGKAAKPVAFLLAGVIALGGVTLVQDWMGGQRANAWVISGDGTARWAALGGQFNREVLYVSQNLEGKDIGGIMQPWLRNSFAQSDILWVAGKSNLGTGPGNTTSIAVGPNPAKPGELALFGWSAAGNLYRADNPVNGAGDEYSYGDMTTTTRLGWDMSTYGGEMNQKNGYLYINTGTNDTIVCHATLGNNTDNGGTARLAIIGLTDTDMYTVSTTGSNYIKHKPGTDTLCQIETKLGYHTDYRTWEISSDMATDAEGNFYLWASWYTVHYLIKVEPPRDDNGDFLLNGDWYYSSVMRLDSKNLSRFPSGAYPVIGMAFLNGDLYLLDQDYGMWRINPLTGGAEYIMDTGGDDYRDLASAQMAPVVTGKLYLDADGDGELSQTEREAPGVAGAQVDIIRISDGAILGELTTDANGEYSGLLPSSVDDIYVRVKQPQVNVGTTSSPVWVNATQTWGGYFLGTDSSTAVHNKVEPYCTVNGSDNVLMAASGPCYGSKANGIDKTNVSNVLTDSLFISKVTMETDYEVAHADFGFTIAGSWGDAQASTKSTAVNRGPYHINTPNSTVQMGAQAGSYADGINDAASNAHSTDDGVFVLVSRPCASDETAPCYNRVPLQDEILSLGRTYNIEVQTSSSPATVSESQIKVNGWISPINSTTLSASSTRFIENATPVDGKVETSYTPAVSPAPSLGISPAVMRFSASTASGITEPDNTNQQYAPAAGSTAADTARWVSDGEIEDYQVWLAQSQVRLALKSEGGTVTNQAFTLQNVVDGLVSPLNPSRTSDAITTTASGVVKTSNTSHAIKQQSANTIITAATLPNGYQLKSVSCYGSATGVAVPTENYTVDKVNRTVTINGGFFGSTGSVGTWNDVTCEFTVSKQPDQTSTFELSTTTAQTGTDVTATVTAKAGGQPLSGEEVEFTVPANVTVKSVGGATLTSPYKCTTDSTGSCAVKLTSTVVGTYEIHGLVNANGTWTEANDNPGHDPAKQSPQSVTFTASPAASGSIALTDTGSKYADYQSGDADYAPDDYYTLDIYIKDGYNNGITGLETADFAFTCPNATASNCGTASYGVFFGSVAAVAGDAGHYQVPVYANKSGVKRIAVTMTGLTATEYAPLPKQGDASQRYVTATFKAMEKVDLSKSTFTVNTAGTVKAGYVSDATPGAYRLGTITLVDKNGNPVTGAASRLSAAASNPDELHLLSFAEVSGTPGTYTVNVHSSDAGSYTPVVSYVLPAPAQSVTLTADETADFIEDVPDLSQSSFEINDTADKKANNSDYYTGTVTLLNADGKPIRNGLTELTFEADPAAGVSFSNLTCVSPAGKCTGVYTVRIKSQYKGTKTITALYDMAPAPMEIGLQTATFVQPDLSLTDSVFEVSPSGTVLPDGTSAFTATATLWDAGNYNPIQGTNVVFTISPTGQATLHNGSSTSTSSLTVASSMAGIAGVTVTSTRNGTYSLCAKVSGENIPGSCHDITFAADSWSDDYTTYQVSTAKVVADSTSTGTITVNLRDGHDLPVSGSAANLAAGGPFGSGLVISQFTETSTQGVYTATFKGPNVGTYHIEVTASGGLIGGEGHTDVDGDTPNHYAHMVVGGLCTAPGTSGMVITPNTSLWADGVDEFTITSTLKDCYGHGLTDWVGVPSKYWPYVTVDGSLASTSDYTLTAPVHQGNGVYTQKLSATLAGSYTVASGYGATSGTATAVGSVVAVFNPAEPTQTSSSYVLSTGDKVANGTDTHTITVTLKNDQGQAVEADASTLKATTAPSDTTVSAFQPVMGQPGVYQATVTTRVAGTKTVTVTWNQGQANGFQVNPATQGLNTLKFVAGPVDRDKTLASFDAQGTTALANGTDKLWAKMMAQDANGNPVEGVNLTFKLTQTGDAPVFQPVSSGLRTITVASGNDGYATVYVVSSFEGAFPVVGEYDSQTTGAKTLNFQNNTADKDQSWFAVARTAGNSSPDKAIADNADSYTVTVVLHDSNNAPVNGIGAVVEMTPAAGGATQTFNVTTGVVSGQGGTAVQLLKTTVAGEYVVTVRIAADQISLDTAGAVTKSKTVEFVAGEASGVTSKLVSPGSPAQVGGGVQTVTAQVRDQYNNPVKNATVTFTIPANLTVGTVDGPAQVQVSTGTTGNADLNLTSHVVGVYNTITAKMATSSGQVSITDGSPARVEFINSACSAAQSDFTIPSAGVDGATEKEVGVEYHNPTVTVKDGSGNVCTAESTQVSFRYRLAGTTTWTEHQPAISSSTGVAEWSDWTEQVAGTYEVQAFFGGIQVGNPGITKTAKFKAGPVDSTTSTLEVSKNPALANNDATHSAAVVVRDQYGNPIAGQKVTISIESGSAAVAGPVIKGTYQVSQQVTTCDPADGAAPSWCDQKGLAYVEFTSNEPGQFAVTATLNGTPVNGSPASVTFVSGKVDPAKSGWVISPDTVASSTVSVVADGSSAYTLTASINSVSNIPVPDAAVRIVSLDPSVLVSPSLEGFTGQPADGLAKYGKFTWTLTSLARGAFTGQVQVASDSGWANVGSQFTVRFDADVAVAANSVLSIPTTQGVPGTKLADGLQRHRAEVLAKDANQNLKAGAVVTFKYRLQGSSDAFLSGEAITGENGVAVFEFGTEKAGVYEVRAYLSGDEVSASPKTAEFVAGAVCEATTLGSLEVQESTAMANGSQTLWVKMTALDCQSNPVAGQALQFTLTNQATESPVFTPLASGQRTISGTSGQDGVVQVNVVSQYENPKSGSNYNWEAFPVVGSYTDSGNIKHTTSTPKYVKFQNNTGDPLQSWFTVARTNTNSSPDKAIADGNDSYTVTVNLRDADGDPVNGIGAVIKVTAADGSVTQYSVTSGVVSGQPGTAVQAVKTTKAGLYDVTVELAGDKISLDAAAAAAKSKSIEFVAGMPSQLTSSLTSPASPAQVGGGTQVITAIVRDAQGNPVPGTAVGFTIPDDVAAGSSTGPTTVAATTGTTGAAAGVAELTLTSDKVGEYSVTAKVGTLAITIGSPAKAKFVNSDPSATQSVFTIPSAGSDGLTEKTVSSQFHTPQLQVKDAQGNAYVAGPVTVTFKARLQGESTWSTIKTIQTDQSTGVALWSDWTQAVAGTYEVEASVTQGTVGTRTAIFKAGAVNPGTSRFETSTGKVLNNDADTHYAKVTAKDANGNPVGGVPVTFTLEAGKSAHFVPGTAKTVTVNTAVSGLAQVEIASSAVEFVSIQAQIDSTLVGVSAPQLNPAELEFGTGGPNAQHSEWTITPNGPITADGVTTYTATVTVRDVNDLAVPNAEVTFSVPAAVHITEMAPYRTNTAGVVTVHFTSEVQGTYTVNALLGAAKVPTADRQITFVAGAINAVSSSLAGPGVTAVADGASTLAVTATVKDAQGNAVGDATVRFSVPAGVKAGTVAGPAMVDVAVDPSTGVATVALTSVKAGTYNVTAQAKKAADAAWTAIATGSPAQVQFVAGAIDPTHSKISKVEEGPFVAGIGSYTVKVELLDANDNPVKQAGLPVQFTFTLGSDVVPASATTNANGVATTTFGNTKAGDWQGTATYSSQPVTVGSPVDLSLTAGTADAVKSTLEVSKNPAQADNTATHYAKVVVRDANSNPIVGQSVTIAITQGASDVPGPVVKGIDTNTVTVTSCDPEAADAPEWCDQKGLAYVEFTSSEPGSFQVSAKLDGVTPVTDSPAWVSFASGPADPSKSSWTISPDTVTDATVTVPANGTSAYTLTTTINSVASILVPQAAVRINGLNSAVTVSPALLGSTGTPTDGANQYGKFTWTLKSTTKGTFTGQVQVNTGSVWANVGQPFTVRFSSDTADAASSWLVEPAGEVAADGATTQTVTAKVYDVHGNAADNGTVVFTLPSGVSPSGTQSVNVVDGVASVQVTATAAGTYKVTAKLDNEAINTVKDATQANTVRTNGQAQVKFGSGTVDPDQSVLTVPTAGSDGKTTKVADNAQTHRAEVLTVDAHNNVVSGVTVEFSYGPEGSQATTVTAVSGTDGVASIEFASALAATYTVTARIAGDEVSGSPKTAKFVAGPLNVEQTLASFEVQQTSAVANGSQA
ncbi:MAG: Ig-like domain-containing protein, partial [Bifidobacteriaceae bacterium]|nr:Ig-like domain-containing protein [Bifidobacteriaceae bacterium]